MVARPDPCSASRPIFRPFLKMAASALCCILASCVSLEFDRMTGTTFPPQQMVNGQPVNLETIYSAAGIKLDVQEDDTAIQPLNIAEDDCISDATWQQAKQFFDDAEMIHLVMAAGCYRVVSGTLNSCGVQLDEGVPGWPTPPNGRS